MCNHRGSCKPSHLVTVLWSIVPLPIAQKCFWLLRGHYDPVRTCKEQVPDLDYVAHSSVHLSNLTWSEIKHNVSVHHLPPTMYVLIVSIAGRVSVCFSVSVCILKQMLGLGVSILNWISCLTPTNPYNCLNGNFNFIRKRFYELAKVKKSAVESDIRFLIKPPLFVSIFVQKS